LLVIGKETKSTVSDDFKMLLLSDNPLLKLPFKHLEGCFRCQEASLIGAPRRTIIIRLLPDIVDHILCRCWVDDIHMKEAAATTHRRLGTICAVGLLTTINNTKMRWVAYFHRCLDLSCSSIVIDDWGNITGVQTTISIRLHQAAPKLSDFPAGLWQISDCSIHDLPNGCIEDLCNYRKY
jgi:hypothetical protein